MDYSFIKFIPVNISLNCEYPISGYMYLQVLQQVKVDQSVTSISEISSTTAAPPSSNYYYIAAL